MNVTLEGVYKLQCEREPYHMDIHIKAKDDSLVRPAPIRYIFKLDNKQLILCGPSGSSMERPLRFEGPGLCVLQRTETSRPGAKSVTSRTASTTDTSPNTNWEFQRNVTDSSQVSLKTNTDENWSRGVSEDSAISRGGPAESSNECGSEAWIRGASEETRVPDSPAIKMAKPIWNVKSISGGKETSPVPRTDQAPGVQHFLTSRTVSWALAATTAATMGALCASKLSKRKAV